MAMKLAIDLHKVAKFVNLAIPLLALLFVAAGIFFSRWWFLPAAFLLALFLLNLYFLFGQKRNPLLRNFGVLAQSRYILESLGPELRQYLFTNDTEERPFNRVERKEVYRKAANQDSTLSFGSQGQFDHSEVKVRHSMFPTPVEQLDSFRLTFGDRGSCPNPFTIENPIIISAMSYGALGEQAVRSLSRGAKKSHIMMNTGEGGFPKYHLMEQSDLIFQMGTAKFGVRNDDGSLCDDKLRQLAREEFIRMVEIKFSQGAKPGKGGLLPKEKITKEISDLRGVPMGKDVVSPPGHIECTDAASTVRFIQRVQDVSELPVGIKLCFGEFNEFVTLVDEMIAQDVFPDWIAIDGAEGGTGAAPQSFMDQVGVPLLPGLHTANQVLLQRGVRSRTKLLAAGKLVNAGRMLVAMTLGADACYTARGFMLALGCIQALQCGRNTCPIGITTHDPELQRGMDIEIMSTRIENYVHNLMHDFKQILAATGHKNPSQLTLENLYVPDGTALAEAIARPFEIV